MSLTDPPSWISEIDFLTDMQFRDTFCVIVLNFMEIGHTVADISQFFSLFLVKCKNSLGNRP